MPRPLTDRLSAPTTRCCGHHDAFGILHDCHEHILERLARLETLGRELSAGSEFGERHLAGLCDVLAFLDTAVPIHSADEEKSLFPRLRAMSGSMSGHTPMDCMEQEHVEHQALMAVLKRAVVKRDAAAAGRAALNIVGSYRDHIGREEEVLYPWARSVLTSPALVDAMTQEMRLRRQLAGLSSC